MKIIIDGRYIFDREKFILKVHSGEIYRTRYRGSEVLDNDGFLSVTAKLIYKINKDFIIDNYEKLTLQKIVEKKMR